MTTAFRGSEGLPMFQSRITVIPQAADDLKKLTQKQLTWLDGLMAGKTWVAGERFTLADILLFCFLQFGASVGQPINPDNTNIVAWLERVKARVAEKASA